MSPPRFSHVKLALQVMEEGDIEGVTNHIMAIAGDDRPLRIWKVFKCVKARIMLSNKYRSEEGMKRLQELRDMPGRSEKDRNRLTEIINSPLSRIRWAQNHPHLFDDAELGRAFRDVRIVKDPFYDFKCPDHIQAAASIDKKRKIEEDHDHKTHKAESYHFTEEEIDAMIQQAIDYCQSENNWSVRANSVRMLEAIGLLTGRRKWEIASTLKLRSVPGHDYQAEIRGLGKQLFEQDWQRIPLLAPIDVVVAGISKARKYAHSSGNYHVVKRLFPRLTHTHYRDIYSKRAFDQRHINGFHPESCSELWWKKSALLIELEQIANHYSTMVIDRDEPEHKKQRGCPEVADSVSGPSQHEQQNPV